MGRFLVFFLFFLLGLGAYFLVITYRDTYKILPADLSQPMAIDSHREWRLFTPENESFAVLLPVMPNMTQDSLRDPSTNEMKNYNIYVAERNNGTIFIITEITYPDRESLDENTLKEVKAELLKLHANNTVVSSDTSMFEGHNAIDVELENPQARIKGKAFTVGNTLYVLTYMTGRDIYDPQEYDYFTNSFRLHPSAEKP